MNYVIALCLFGLAYAANPICQLKPEPGPCLAYMPMYYYDADNDECREFIYGGCQGNDNRFGTQKECEKTCSGVQETHEAICHLEPEKGMCLAYMPRYYYNAKERKCEKFIYGGCQGNPNNFKTLEECETRCLVQSADVPVCEQEAETGMCRAYIPRYYHNKHTGQCERFVYGGCGGNDNNFGTKEECEEACAARSTVPVCEQEAETGMCRAYIPRYYYNKNTRQCERFIYGGCDGNDNNFGTKEECEETCGIQSVQSVCEQEAVTGPCKAYFPRYFFNKETGNCERFIYGGCLGNDNNFKTVEECEQTCRGY